MWEDESDLFDEMERRVHALLHQTMAGMHDSLFDIDSKSLKPLYRIEVSDEQLIVTFDLPYVRKEDISLTSTDETLSIEAKMKRPVTMRLGGSIQRHFQFEKYSKKIRLPLRVNPDDARAMFRNGLLVVSYSTAHKGNAVKVV
ncbi:MAG: Hsp20/alpha crystallin family protein [Thaumarchaeota archaeon]|nr:Hsp20/alpha crystallin family protein [Nitrososphaerota archaeon]